MSDSADRVKGDLVGHRVGNYVFERMLGRGRMGVVYLARDTALLRPTAVKVLAWVFDHEFGADPTEWFLDEARHVAKINHPRVVQIYAAAKQGDHRYIAMEFVDGPSAEALVQREGPLSVRRATGILLHVAGALQAAHDAGVIHRDVKPANILVPGSNEGAKLGDFGMALSARTLREGKGRVRAGTPYCTAPELWQGAVASPSSDIYALGTTYYYLLTGKWPFPASSTSVVREMHLSARVPNPRKFQSNIPMSAVTLLHRALAKCPRHRFDSASAVAREAAAILRALNPGGASGGKKTSLSWSAPPNLRGFASPDGVLARSMQFTRRPFSSIDPLGRPYQSDSFNKTLSELKARLQEEAKGVALVGPRGTGRSSLLAALAASLRPGQQVFAVRQGPESERGHLAKRLSAIVGDPKASIRQVGDCLANQAEQGVSRRSPPVVMVDELSRATLAELAELLAMGRRSRDFSIVVCADKDLGERLEPLIDARHDVAPLSGVEVGEYVTAWLTATRPVAAPTLLFSRDALLIIAERSGGVLTRINHLALNALALAAAHGRRVVTSFEAWTAAEDELWVLGDGSLRLQLPSRPVCWPSAEVIEHLQGLRLRANSELDRIKRTAST